MHSDVCCEVALYFTTAPCQGGRFILSEAAGQQSVKDTSGVKSRGRWNSMSPKEESRQKKASPIPWASQDNGRGIGVKGKCKREKSS